MDIDLTSLPTGGSILILGATDVGKSTLASNLTLRHGWDRVAIVDTDAGQGSIGPPSTVAAALLSPDGHKQLLGIGFIGNTSPARHRQRIVDEASRLMAIARRTNPDAILIDTCGYIDRGGRELKSAMLQALSPDVIIAIERIDELGPILESYGQAGTGRDGEPRVWRVKPSPSVRRKSAGIRRRRRESRFSAALDGAKTVVYSIDGLAPEQHGMVGLLAGLLDDSGDCLAIGVIDFVNVDARSIGVRTSVDESAAVRSIVLGDLVMGGRGKVVSECRLFQNRRMLVANGLWKGSKGNVGRQSWRSDEAAL